MRIRYVAHGQGQRLEQDKTTGRVEEIKRLTFYKLKRIQTENGLLVDCANEFWRAVLRKERCFGT